MRKGKPLILALTLLLFLSAFFISLETHHRCSGKDCPICSLLSRCERLLGPRGAGPGQILFLAALLPLSAPFYGYLPREETLVGQKVRLDR